MKIETKQQQAERAALVRSRIEARKAKRGGKSKAQVQAAKVATPVPTLSVVERINQAIKAREERAESDRRAFLALKRAGRLAS